MIKLFLFDIEGTTTDINFVHKVLFPYSYKCLEHYILHHQTHPLVIKALEDVRKTIWEEEQIQLGLYDVIEKLRKWISIDRKHPALKEIQGLIWDIGYSKGEFQGHLYTDVKPFFVKILSTKTSIGIYSSGSVHAQKLIFGFSIEGTMSPIPARCIIALHFLNIGLFFLTLDTSNLTILILFLTFDKFFKVPEQKLSITVML